MKIAIIGAGAAGLMCAGKLAENRHDVTVFEKRNKVARKILVTGKGRCNVTNNCEIDEYLENIPRNPRFLHSAIRSFAPKDAISFFDEIGLKVKTERGNRVFPESDSAMEVVDKLLEFCTKNKVMFIHEPVLDVISNTGEKIDGVKTKSGRYDFDVIIIATGGLSYSKTGSDGDGYKFAKKFGHSIIDTEASLVGLHCSNTDVKSLAGLSLKNVEATLFNVTKPIYKDFGEMLFTHEGVSGPMILSSSAHMNDGEEYSMKIDLKPALTKEQLDKRLLRDFEKNNHKNFQNALDELLPRKIIPVIISRCGIDPFAKVHSLNKKDRQILGKILKNFEISDLVKGDIEQAIITRGGISTKEINPKNMESKKIQGLHFIGEVIDVDAYTGGFNLQIAWATANLVANSFN